jgi:glycyl-tRNA synthetase
MEVRNSDIHWFLLLKLRNFDFTLPGFDLFGRRNWMLNCLRTQIKLLFQLSLLIHKNIVSFCVGTSGLYDFGPPGTSLLANFVDVWRKHFVLEEDMLEVDATILTPHEVLKTSGHVDRFCDWMVKDKVNGDIYRADHLVENVLSARLDADKRSRMGENGADGPRASATGPNTKKTKAKVELNALTLDDAKKLEYEETLAKIDNYGGKELGELILKHQIKTQEGNDVTSPVEFNLMFETMVGPTGDVKGYLRPETAQGQFVNFSKLLEFNNGRMPFASCSVGRSFRNEISPRNGLLRVREFLMAEIEHYVDPLDKSHPGFETHRHVVLNLLPAATQLSGSTLVAQIKMGEAVESKLIDNQTLGYFLARVHLFLEKIGVRKDMLRFRQHMSNEMAHYACDCWDAELLTSHGWIECVGCADRSAFDLTRHSERTGKKLVVRQALAEPRVVSKWQIVINRKLFGPCFKRGAKEVERCLMDMEEAAVLNIKEDLESDRKCSNVRVNGQNYVLTNELVTVDRVTTKEHVREYTPNVIEPSFGIGRILHSVLEHAYYVRQEDQARAVLAFTPCMAPIKCLVVPLSNNTIFNPIIDELRKSLRKSGMSSKIDDSASSIGKRYARNDEIGTPFAITVDFQSVKDRSVTLRERDSTQQIRTTIENVLKILVSLISEETSWPQICKIYPVIAEQKE